ncbi:DHA1 family inner membrane transport protein [Pseudonocardia sediminis]|uniref:DHA1 family inner membrane transport protein n=1 Tax=Pseudonocardia sediminis TaxID=1397368 RepID=A0A4Q7UQN2_PSEST|nr:MFS transporter [Pseudonocardia sediminis]RZT83866.1 DHA1 family inner membrane transport protein [Pseudonocardia sediminis]
MRAALIRTRTPLALAALAVGAFAIGTGEFVIMGLLPDVAGGLAVDIPDAGALISAYAIGVVVGAPLLIAASNRFRRKAVLIALMAAYALFNVVSAIAPTYDWVLVARFLSGLPHGAFFGIGAVVAGNLVSPEFRARAMAKMFAGLTLANVAGVPVSTLLGQQLGWRWVFGVVGLIGAVAAVSVAAAVPDVRSAPVRLGQELRALGRRPVWMALLIATVGGAVLFSTYSYITPMLTEVAGFTPTAVTLMLALFGIGMTVGNLVGARLADHATMPTIYGALIADIVLALLFIPALENPVTAIVVMFAFAVSTFMLVPAVQLRIISGAGDAPNLASGANQAAFNVANALGAALGGVVISAGLGYASPNLVAAGLAVAGLGIAIVAGRSDRRDRADAHELVGSTV